MWYNPPQNEQGAKHLLNLLQENYNFSVKYFGDVSKLTIEQVELLYKSEVQNLKCDSNGKYCSYGCSHGCLKAAQKETKQTIKGVLLTLIKKYQKFIQ